MFQYSNEKSRRRKTRRRTRKGGAAWLGSFFSMDRAIYEIEDPIEEVEIPSVKMVSEYKANGAASFQEKTDEKCEYELLLLGGLECLFVEKTIINGYECFTFDVMPRTSFLDPHMFSKCVERIDESLDELTRPYRETPTKQESHTFMSLHFPVEEALRHVINHVSSIRQGIQFGPSDVLRRLVSYLTIHNGPNNTRHNVANGPTHNVANGPTRKKKRLYKKTET